MRPLRKGSCSLSDRHERNIDKDRDEHGTVSTFGFDYMYLTESQDVVNKDDAKVSLLDIFLFVMTVSLV